MVEAAPGVDPVGKMGCSPRVRSHRFHSRGARTTGVVKGWETSTTGHPRRLYRWIALAAVLAVSMLGASCSPQLPIKNAQPTLPTTLEVDPAADHFIFSTVLEGFDTPTNVAFAPDGRVFVAEKKGIIKTFDSIDDPTPEIAADMEDEVRSVGEHGLIGLTVDNEYPARPYIYASYSWDITGLWGDACDASYQVNGCVTGSRVSRITLDSNGLMVGSPESLVDDRWCYQFGAHAIGSVEMMEDGSLLVTSGEGASWTGTDYGQYGGTQLFPAVPNLTPKNACGDPPDGVGFAGHPSVAEGGSLRSQDLLTPGDPLGWNGAIVRIDPDTGESLADNPLHGGPHAHDDEMLAHGLRNPTRFTQRPGSKDIYIGNVGQAYAEEIDVVSVDGPVKNFGWPCREGDRTNLGYETLENHMCETLISDPASPSILSNPWLFYTRPHVGAAITGLRFVPDGQYPAEYVGDLFFVDYVQGNVWSVEVKPDGSRRNVPPRAVAYRTNIVALVDSPDGYIYGVDIATGTIERLVGADSPPVADLVASPQQGPLPFTSNLDASGSAQPGGGILTFAWDLDDDGVFDDATGPTASVNLNTNDNHDVSVRVTNESGASSVATETLFPGNTAPVIDVTFTTPMPWEAGAPIEFDIVATDAEDGPLSGPSVQWETLLRHCYEPTDCHSHPHAIGTGTSGATEGPSHGYPSFLELAVRATDSRGQTTESRMDLLPATTGISVTSSVPGVTVLVGESTFETPFTYTAILGDQLEIGVSPKPLVDGVLYLFDSWSDGGDAAHGINVTGDMSLHLTLVPQ